MFCLEHSTMDPRLRDELESTKEKSEMARLREEYISRCCLKLQRELESERRLREEYKSRCSCLKLQRPLPPLPVYRFLGQYCSFPLEKKLTTSDKVHGRLVLITSDVKQYLLPLLSTGEIAKIRQMGGISVYVYDCQAKIYEMKLTCWGKKAYVLTSPNWIRFCDDHDLLKQGEDNWITLWMFKHVFTYQICFYIVSGRIDQ